MAMIPHEIRIDDTASLATFTGDVPRVGDVVRPLGYASYEYEVVRVCWWVETQRTEESRAVVYVRLANPSTSEGPGE